MKREQCNMSAQQLTVNDARIIAEFRVQLGAVYRLKREGHTHGCAVQMALGSALAPKCTCGRVR